MRASPEQVVLLTYNIHRALGCDGRLDPARIAGAILDLDADVVALQELETPVVRTPMVLIERLAAAGYEPVLGPTILSERHSYGNALLTRLPVLSQRPLDLSIGHREPRGLIDAQLDLTPGWPPLRCLATHLGLDRDERRRQIQRIAARLDRGRVHHQGPTVLLGDFNEWRHSARLRPIDERLRPAPGRATWPSRWPLLALDRIWYGEGLVLLGCDAMRTRQARLASDHLPLHAAFRLLPRLDAAQR